MSCHALSLKCTLSIGRNFSLKPLKFAADEIFISFFFSTKIRLDDSHEISSLIFS